MRCEWEKGRESLLVGNDENLERWWVGIMKSSTHEGEEWRNFSADNENCVGRRVGKDFTFVVF